MHENIIIAHRKRKKESEKIRREKQTKKNLVKNQSSESDEELCSVFQWILVVVLVGGVST